MLQYRSSDVLLVRLRDAATPAQADLLLLLRQLDALFEHVYEHRVLIGEESARRDRVASDPHSSGAPSDPAQRAEYGQEPRSG